MEKNHLISKTTLECVPPWQFPKSALDRAESVCRRDKVLQPKKCRRRPTGPAQPSPHTEPTLNIDEPFLADKARKPSLSPLSETLRKQRLIVSTAVPTTSLPRICSRASQTFARAGRPTSLQSLQEGGLGNKQGFGTCKPSCPCGCRHLQKQRTAKFTSHMLSNP